MTTVFHRVPAGLPINGINESIGSKPHCDSCGHKLKPYEYLPLISWFSTCFKCNYCGVQIPKVYATIEATIMLISIMLLSAMGMNLSYVLAVPSAALIVLNIAFYLYYRKVFTGVLLFTITVVAVFLIFENCIV